MKTTVPAARHVRYTPVKLDFNCSRVTSPENKNQSSRSHEKNYQLPKLMSSSGSRKILVKLGKKNHRKIFSLSTIKTQLVKNRNRYILNYLDLNSSLRGNLSTSLNYCGLLMDERNFKVAFPGQLHSREAGRSVLE